MKLRCLLGSHQFGKFGENKNSTLYFIRCHWCGRWKEVTPNQIARIKLYSKWDLTWGKVYKKYFERKRLKPHSQGLKKAL